MTRNEWASNVLSSIKDVLKDEHDIIANYLFPITSVLFLGIGVVSLYRCDLENAKLSLGVGGGTGGYSLGYRLYEKLSK